MSNTKGQSDLLKFVQAVVFILFVVQGLISTALHLWKGHGMGLLERLAGHLGLDFPWWGGLLLALVGLGLLALLDPERQQKSS